MTGRHVKKFYVSKLLFKFNVSVLCQNWNSFRLFIHKAEIKLSELNPQISRDTKVLSKPPKVYVTTIPNHFTNHHHHLIIITIPQIPDYEVVEFQLESVLSEFALVYSV